MSDFTGAAILLRRIDYGDADLILSFLTREAGKASAIAKSAKKSVKRFGGILEPFSLLHVVWKQGRGGLPILQEAALRSAFFHIRSDIRKTAYASYWTELVHEYAEEGAPEESLYGLLCYALHGLDSGAAPAAALSILFQIHFAALSGFRPELGRCNVCGTPLEAIPAGRLLFDIPRGGVVCGECGRGASRGTVLSKGTIKQLLWTGRGDYRLACRVRFSETAIREGLSFLESFIPYHLGKRPKSLSFLQKIRGEAPG